MLIGARFCAADPIPWDANAQGRNITALCADPQGHVFIATEGQGVWQFDPAAPKDKQYTQFTTKDGLGSDDVYALLSDAKGRLWAGTLHGLSVYNGRQWKTYGPTEGVGGFRVFALAACPTTGDLWIATEGGLTRYLVKQDRWTQYSRLDGLPSDAVQCLAFNKRGDLFVGTQADGIAIATAAADYKTWRVVRGPAQMPSTPGGAGLPTDLMNCLCAASDGTVYAGTTTGLARSGDNGLTWRFLRGADWEAKVAGLYHGPKPVKTDTHGLSLLEDWVTCLADDGAGHLLVGHRQQGLEVVSLKDGSRLFPGPKDSQPTDFVNALLPLSDGSALIGGCGGGLLQMPLPGAVVKPAPAPQAASAQTAFPALPSSAKPPTLAELNAMLRVVSAVAPDKAELQPKAVALDDDWTTKGDWQGRYGRYWACLCAMSYAPFNYIWGAGWQKVDYRTRIGPNHGPGDKARYWVNSPYTVDPRALELPPTYLDSRIKKGLTRPDVYRRESEVDDHGEAYPLTMDGPHDYVTLTVPSGLFYLSLYDNNYNGYQGRERTRDYRLSVRPHLSTSSLADSSHFPQQPEWAHGRIENFWGGVWKRFLVRGPVALTIEVNRNNSMNTILPAVMLDLVDEEPPPYFQTVSQWEAQQAQQNKIRQLLAAHPALFHAATSEAEAANSLCRTLTQVQVINSAWYAANSRRFYRPLLAWYAAQARQPSAKGNSRLQQRLATCYYQMGIYPQWEEAQKRTGLTSAREIEKALRWDGVTNTDSDYNVVTNFLTSHPQIMTANNNTVDASSRRNLEISQLAKRGKHIEH